MRRIIWLSALTAGLLVAGGCKQQETTPPAPQPAPVVTTQQEQAQPPTAVAEKSPTPTPAAADTPAPPAPVKVTYKATNGNVTFDHQQHVGNNVCSSCHPTDPPAKIVLDKDKAHQLCKGCHQQNGTGPTQCNGCHKKG